MKPVSWNASWAVVRTLVRTLGQTHFGIRARLLALLLPGVLGLMLLDSCQDNRALGELVQQAHDPLLLEAAQQVAGSVAISGDGSLVFTGAALAAARFDGSAEKSRFVSVALLPQAAGLATPSQLPAAAAAPAWFWGPPDLPQLPARLREAATSSRNNSSNSSNNNTNSNTSNTGSQPPFPGALSSTLSRNFSSTFFDSFYRGTAVRVLHLRQDVSDGRGQRFALLTQATESRQARTDVQALAAQQALLRDGRMALLLLLLVWLGVAWSLQPLKSLRQRVLQTRQSHLPDRLDTRQVPHEVAPLAEAVNLHVERLRSLLGQQAQFLADASHQLRTPLAILLTQAGVALREHNPEQVRQTLKAMVTQLGRSRRLCEQLLCLAEASAPHAAAATALSTASLEVVDLNTIAREVVLQYLAMAHEKNHDLGWVDAAAEFSLPILAVPVQANATQLHEALSNLLHNAILHTLQGGCITVQARRQAGLALAEVCDNGPGIEAARRASVFERFQHQASGNPGAAEASHQRQGQGQRQEQGQRQGAGLGLAIARTYARQNGGDIELGDAPFAAHALAASQGDSSRSPGLCAVLRLPLAPGF